MEQKKGWKKGLLITLCVILGLILVVMIFATVYVNYLLNRMNRIDPNQESTMSPSQALEIMLTDPDLETIDPNGSETYIHIDDITFPTDPPVPTDPIPSGDPDPTNPVQTTPPTQPQPTEPSVYGDHLVNILLVGQDRRPGEGRQRSDSMILVSFNKSTDTITLTSFMRDQYVQIPGYKPNKLNAAYQFGGMNLLCQTLAKNFGVQVDGVVEVDFSGFEDIIDLLGGVDITMTQKEVDYFNTFTDWNLVAGENHLSGEQALAYARLREIDTDYRRAERQRKVLAALIEAYKSQPLTQLLGLLDDILPMITTNMSNAEILGYATDLFPMLSGSQLETLRIPQEGTYDSGKVEVRDGFTAWFQYNIDFAANRKLLYEVFAPAE